MLNVIDYIKNYAQSHGIADYELKQRIITLEQFSKSHSFAPGVAFFHKLIITGDILNVADLAKPLLTADTVSDFFDFSKMVTVADFGTVQRVESDFIMSCDNMLTLKLSQGEGAMFENIYSAQLLYIYMQPKPQAVTQSSATNTANKMQPATRSTDIYINRKKS